MARRPRVIVVGSGAAGMAAAVAAASEGARVTVLEAASQLGGTTAISGGGIWIPASPWAAAAGVEDSADDALRYLAGLDLGDCEPELTAAYVREGPRVAQAIERASALRWRHLAGFPDYHAERDGGKAAGRSLEIEPVRVSLDALDLVRRDPYGQPPVTIAEEAAGGVDADEVERRRREGVATRGRGLVAGLLEALRQLGGSVRTGVRVRTLVASGGAVTAVDAGGERLEGAVVLATGGFERDPALVRAFLRGPLAAPAGPPANCGDGLRMAMAAGAALGGMSEAWWCPAVHVPGETIDGEPFYRMLFLDCAKPGGILVDARGRRFADEAVNYNDLGRALHELDPVAYAYPRVPSWLVFDAARCARYRLGFLALNGEEEWVARAPTIEGLAERVGVPPRALRATVERFNEQAARGADEDFGRGSTVFDRFSGETERLRALLEPPFFAVRVLPGCLGTKGGPRIDEHGRVLSADGSGRIPGLHAAGNAAASPFGCAYPGPGATIGPALVFGWRAGAAAAASAS